MLRHLSIRNYALIDSLQMDMQPGLSTLTGETGAGKSVIIGALSLLTGQRADTSRLRDKQQRAVIEAEFDTADIRHLKPLFEASDMQWEDSALILRREIAPDGRSRIFVNDSPVSLKQLSLIGPSIIDIHSQHSNLMLEDADYRLHIIDLLADNQALLNDYIKHFRRYAELRNRLHRLKTEQQSSRANIDYLRLQLDRLRKLAPKKGELQALEREQEILANAESISVHLSEANNALLTGDTNSVALLDQAINALNSIPPFQLGNTPKEGEELLQRIHSSYIEIKDIAETINGFASEVVADPVRQAKVTSRIEAYYDAIAALGVQNGDELVTKQTEIEQRLQDIDDDSAIERLEAETADAAAGLRKAAATLTASRTRCAEEFARRLVETATPLGMKNLRFEAQVTPAKLSKNGGDTVEFMCSFNKNAPMMPVQKVASGGEISRLMLALKSLLAEKMGTPVLVFDEVDTGVSGEIADKMGKMMSAIAGKSQVIAITHLPQVAARGERQYLVSKADNEHSTLTSIRLLTPDERVEELARMLSGESINEAARNNARALLDATNK